MTNRATWAAAVLAAAAAFPAGAVDFVDAFRDARTACMLSPIGEIYTVDRERGIHKAFIFRNAQDLPYRWQSPPASIVFWENHWLVADGTNRLVRFDANGLFDAII